LVTCNFELTLHRLERALRGLDLWLLVADSKGINVWCAAGADELSTRSVVSVVKTSSVGDEVDHRTLILPPLCAPSVRAVDVTKETGWKVRWGPIDARDIPAYLARGERREEPMKRISWSWWERLDAGIGSMFAFYLLVGAGFAVFASWLLLDYFLITGIGFMLFLLLAPWLPGKHGLTKLLWFEIPLALMLLFGGPYLDALTTHPWRADVIIAMSTLLAFCGELGGMAPHLPADFDPFIARLGIRSIGNTAFAGTVRTDLLLGRRELTYDEEQCTLCRTCAEICPIGLWEVDKSGASLKDSNSCTACRACLTQCPTGAIEAPAVSEPEEKKASKGEDSG